MLLTLWSGLVLGAVYALVSFGLTITVLAAGSFNFAQGAIVVVGTYLTYSGLAVEHVGLLGVLALNTLVGMALGVLCEVVAVRPLRGRGAGLHGELITTLGLSMAIVGVVGLGWGYEARAVPFEGPATPVRLLGVVARPEQIVLLAAAVLCAFGLHTWFNRTRWGQGCLAAAEDREAASLRGIDVSALSLAGFAAAGALGTLSAIAIGPITYAIPTSANTLAVGGFVAIALGGHGRFLGGLCGGLLVGVAASLATRYLDANYANLAVLALLLAALAARPGGLGAGEAVRRV